MSRKGEDEGRKGVEGKSEGYIWRGERVAFLRREVTEVSDDSHQNGYGGVTVVVVRWRADRDTMWW